MGQTEGLEGDQQLKVHIEASLLKIAVIHRLLLEGGPGLQKAGGWASEGRMGYQRPGRVIRGQDGVSVAGLGHQKAGQGIRSWTGASEAGLGHQRLG